MTVGIYFGWNALEWFTEDTILVDFGSSVNAMFIEVPKLLTARLIDAETIVLFLMLDLFELFDLLDLFEY